VSDGTKPNIFNTKKHIDVYKPLVYSLQLRLGSKREAIEIK